MRLLSNFFKILGVLSLIFILFSFFLINEIVHPDIEDTEDSYESIAVLSGNIDRVIKASELYKSKNVKYIYLSKENRVVESFTLDSEPIPVYQYYTKVFVDNGINQNDIILFGDNKNTYDEILALSKMLKDKSSKILLITDQYHISRVQKIVNYFDLSSKIDFCATDVNQNKKLTKILLQHYILEYVKLLNFYLTRLNINVVQYN